MSVAASAVREGAVVEDSGAANAVRAIAALTIADLMRPDFFEYISSHFFQIFSKKLAYNML